MLRQFLAQARPGDYLALMAYITENPANDKAFEDIRSILQDHLHIVTTLGYGPRFLHSTGQFHKGGPNTGLFLQLTADDVEDVPIPGAPYTFAETRAARGTHPSWFQHRGRAGGLQRGPDVCLGA
jgi:hypothetical protein